MRMVILVAAFALMIVSLSPIHAGERAFSWTHAPARGDYVGVALNTYNLGKYLNECEVNRPEILRDVKMALEDGEFYRKATTDQKGKHARITVNVTPDYTLRIVTVRNDTCQACKGTGRLMLPFESMTRTVGVARKCRECDGKGYLENNTTEKYFILSAEDFENPKEGRRVLSEQAYAGAPRDAEEWVERLVSKDPRERLEACEWLDEHYVRVGAQFQSLMPMLKKARYQESNEKQRMMVWQFWAGKDLSDARDRAFYRIYVNTKSGKVTKKGFYAMQ